LVRCPRMWRGSTAPWVMGGSGGDRVRLWREGVGPEYRACHANLILGRRMVTDQQVALQPPSPVGRGQGVEAPRATPHGPAVPIFPPPPWPPVRAFHGRIEGLQPVRRHFQEEPGGLGGIVGARAGPGGDSWWSRVYLHVSPRGLPLAPPPTPFPLGWLPTCGKPRGGSSFWTGTGTGGRANNNKSEGRDEKNQ